MPSIDRPLSGDAILFHLADEEAAAAHSTETQPRKSTARTLLKEGPLRVTMIIIPPGGGIAEHHSDGPITIQPLKGSVVFKTPAGTFTVGEGELLSLGAGVHHEVTSQTGVTFLLTVAHT